MTESDQFFKDAREELDSYVQNRILLVKLQMAEKTAQLAGRLLLVLFFVLFILSCLFFLSMMAGYYFAELTGSIVFGFGMVAGGYLVLLIILYFVRHKLLQSLINSVVSYLLK